MTVPEILALAADPNTLEALDSEDLKCAFVQLNGHYAGSRESALVPVIVDLYRRWAARSEPTERLAVLKDVTRLAEEESGDPYIALIPFITAEDDHSVISTAALDLASVVPPAEDADASAYAGASWLAEWVLHQDHLEERDGSVLAGLLLLGDRRVLEPCKAIWPRLSSEARHRAARARSGVLFQPHLEFLLWALEDETDHGVFGALAAAILNLSQLSDAVLEIERHLPTWDAPNPDEPIQLLSRHSLRDTGEVFRSQMENLIAAEPGAEKILPRAFAPWLGSDDEEDTDMEPIPSIRPAERARRYGDGIGRADWKGEQFTDTISYWHADEPLCQLALMMKLYGTRTDEANAGTSTNADSDPNNGSEKEVSAMSFPQAFPFYRESVEFGVPGEELDHWLGLATLAGFLFAGSQAFVSDASIGNELKDASTYTASLILFLNQRAPKVGALYSFYQALHQTLGLDRELSGSCTAEQLIGVADRALWLGAGIAQSNDKEAIAWMEAVVGSRGLTLSQRTLIESLIDAAGAQTTGELMIPVLLKLCQRNYDAGTAEAECLGSYFQEAVASGGLSVNDPPERWYADAFAFAQALVKHHGGVCREFIATLAPERLREVEDICEEFCGCGDTGLTENVVVQGATQFVEAELGFQTLSTTVFWNVNRIIHGADLVVWGVLLAAFPHDEKRA